MVTRHFFTGFSFVTGVVLLILSWDDPDYVKEALATEGTRCSSCGSLEPGISEAIPAVEPLELDDVSSPEESFERMSLAWEWMAYFRSALGSPLPVDWRIDRHGIIALGQSEVPQKIRDPGR